jgi:hypothetical protein
MRPKSILQKRELRILPKSAPLIRILADQKTAAAATARHITSRHLRFLDLPPSL